MDSSEKEKAIKITPPQQCRVNREMFPPEEGTIPERVGRIAAEFTEGFELLQKYDLAATFFGTARCATDSKMYKDAEKLASLLAYSGFTIITGGASGIMEAANKGAYEVGGNSVGINIKLPQEQSGNDFITDSLDFHYFFSRKVMLTFASEVYIYFPGGFGTLDEFFEILTLVQTKKIEFIPIVLVGKEYWTPLLEWFEKSLYEENKTISKKDMDIYHLVDSVEEAYTLITSIVCKEET